MTDGRSPVKSRACPRGPLKRVAQSDRGHVDIVIDESVRANECRRDHAFRCSAGRGVLARDMIVKCTEVQIVGLDSDGWRNHVAGIDPPGSVALAQGGIREVQFADTGDLAVEMVLIARIVVIDLRDADIAADIEFGV